MENPQSDLYKTILEIRMRMTLQVFYEYIPPVMMSDPADARSYVAKWLLKEDGMILHEYPPASAVQESEAAESNLNKPVASNENPLPAFVNDATVWALHASHGKKSFFLEARAPQKYKLLQIRYDVNPKLSVADLERLGAIAGKIDLLKVVREGHLHLITILVEQPSASHWETELVTDSYWDTLFHPMLTQIPLTHTRPAPLSPAPAPEPPVILSPLHNKILDLFHAFEDKPSFTFQELAKLTQSDSAAVLQSAAHLIRIGHLNAKLTADALLRKSDTSITCQLCDQTLLNPVTYWQCPTCKRFTCASCQDPQPNTACHNCGAPQLQLPALCPKCKTIFTTLAAVTNRQCPNCQTPL